MDEQVYPNISKDLAQKRRELAPEIYGAFRVFGQRVFADGALPSETKELIAVAVAHVTQCPYCIRGHTDFALQKGRNQTEARGNDLGCRGDARRRRLRTFDCRHRRDASGGS
jgi:AhpD family alkylhydroperoxidase